MGAKKLPDEDRRVLLLCRVTPQTMEFLESLDEDNKGRAVDTVVEIITSLKRMGGKRAAQILSGISDAGAR